MLGVLLRYLMSVGDGFHQLYEWNGLSKKDAALGCSNEPSVAFYCLLQLKHLVINDGPGLRAFIHPSRLFFSSLVQKYSYLQGHEKLRLKMI